MGRFTGAGKQGDSTMQPVSRIPCDDLVTDEDREVLGDFLKVLNAEWELKETHAKSGLKVYHQYSEDNPILTVKGEIEVSASVEEVLDFLHAHGSDFPSHMKILDTMCTFAEVLEEHDPKHKVNYARFSVPKPGSDRDFVWSNFSTMLPNGDAACLGTSTTHPSRPPSTSMLGYVRGTLLTSGYYCVKGEHKGKCKVHYVVQADPAGWIPVWAINLVASTQAHNAKRMAKHFAKNNS